MTDWNENTIRQRAAGMRQAAELEREKADMRIQFAVTLEDIAAAWGKKQTAPETMTWLIWGNKVKCSECGAVTDKGTAYCPECGRKSE